MNKITLLIIAVFLTTFAHAQVWNFELTGSTFFPRDLALTATGDSYIYAQNTNNFFTFDETGTVQQTLLNSILPSSFSSVTQVEKVVDGYLVSASPELLSKLDFMGNIVWQFNGNGSLSAPQMINKRLPTFMKKNNDVYFAGIDSLYVVDIATGSVTTTYSLDGSYTSIAIHEDNTDMVVLAEDANNQAKLLVLDGNGNVSLVHNTNMIAYDFIVTNDGFVVVGETNGLSKVKVIERNGNVFWSNTYGSGMLHSIKAANNGFIVSGSDNLNGILLKINNSGSQSWLTTFDETIENSSRTRVVNTNNNNGYIFASTTHLIRTDINGNTSTTSKPLYTNGSAILDVNNVSAMINADGAFFWDYNDAYFRTPTDSATNTIFASGLWMGGFDQGGNLKVAAQTYGSTGNDYQPGYTDWNSTGHGVMI